jgi:hypothetical protein
MEALVDNMRALRRHHYIRRKRNAKKYWFTDMEKSDEQLGFIANTPHPCSRYCCGNPRKHFKEVTKQEKIHTLSFELGAY